MSSVQANGLMSSPQNEKSANTATSQPRVILAGKSARILCVADIRGDYHHLNKLIREHDASAVIHTGDFGFIQADSLDRMGDKILRHLLQYSPLISEATRSQLLAIPASAPRATLIAALNNTSIHFPLSQFPHLISGAITFPVPVFTVYGLIEDVRILEKFRTKEYEVQNLSVIDEAMSTLLDVSGVKLRLFGLGGAIAQHKFFDNGEGHASIAGGQGTMWMTALQIGELIDTAQSVYDPSETRLLVSSTPISRHGLLSLVSNALKTDLTISGGLHFRYPASFNEFAVNPEWENYQAKLREGKRNFLEMYTSVRDKVDASLNHDQRIALQKAITAISKVPETDDGTWQNVWNWILSDASCGHMVLGVKDGRISAEQQSTGLNFAHRSTNSAAPPTAPINAPAPAPVIARTAPSDTNLVSKAPAAPAARAPVGPHGQMPARPPQATTAPGTANPMNIKGIATRPPQSNPTRPNGPNAQTAGQTGAAGSTVPSSIPAKPPTQPRQPRASNAFPNAATGPGSNPRDRPQTDNKPSSTPQPAKSTLPPKAPAAAPQANGKPASPMPLNQKGGRSIPADKKDTPTAGKPSDRTPRDKAGRDEKPKPTRTDTDKSDAKAGDKDKVKEKEADKDKVVEESKSGNNSPREAGARSPTGAKKQNSLYIKGIPDPTSEEELKKLFPDSADKITTVKIIKDHISGKQKNFAYVDFGNEADAQEALDKHTSTIRDTTVSITLSNPPARTPFPPRGRGSFRGRGGRGGSFGGGMTRKDSGSVPSASNGEKKAPAAASGGGGDKKAD